MIKINAYAKLNLNLHVIPDADQKDKTGLYPVHFINCELELHDVLEIKKIPHQIKVNCENINISTNNNSVYQAATLLKQVAGDNALGATITLHKSIPICAGLGGGSSDAAACLHALIKLWSISIEEIKIFSIISKLGTDTFYSWFGGVCEVEGSGEKVTMLNTILPSIWAVIIVPDRPKPSTKYMYGLLNKENCGKNIQMISEMKSALALKDKQAILNSLHNDFETVIDQIDHDTNKIKRKLLKYGAEKSLIAGSGMSVVGLFKDETAAQFAQEQLQVNYNQCLCTKLK